MKMKEVGPGGRAWCPLGSANGSVATEQGKTRKTENSEAHFSRDGKNREIAKIY